MSRIQKWSVVALGLVLLVTMSGLPVSALSYGGLGGRPANPDPANPRTQSIFIYTLDHLATKNDEILMSNSADVDKSVDLYTVDGIVTNTGAFTCKQRSEDRKGAAGWIQLASSTVRLAPNQKEKVGFTITIPADADVGEHNACIVFQPSDDNGEASGNIRLRTRQALRVAITIPGELKRDISIASFGVTDESSKHIVSLGLHNDGNVSADVNAQVVIESLLGAAMYKNGGEYPVLAGQKLDLAFSNDKRPFFGGWYRAYATIEYDKTPGTFGINDKNNLITKRTDTSTIFIAPSVGGGIVLMLGGAAIVAIIGWLLYGYKRRQRERQTWHLVTIKRDMQIDELAAEYRTNWKDIRRVNHLKPPYSIRKGDKIRLPKV